MDDVSIVSKGAKMQSRTRGVFERPSGSDTWWISYCDRAGMRHREKIGRRDEAFRAYADRRRKISEGTYVTPRGRRRGISFGELASAAMEHRRLRIRPRSHEADLSRIKELHPLIAHRPAAEITPGEINKALDALLTGQHASGHHISQATANRYRSLISSIFAFGVQAGHVGQNPVRQVKRLKESDPVVRYLSADEEQRLRTEIRRKSPEHEAEMDLALYTGMRRGEQFTLKWANVDLEHGILRVNGKTGIRSIVVNSSARQALELLSARRAPGTVFVCPDASHEDQIDQRRWFEKAVRAAGVVKFRWHDLRHTFASRLVMAGVHLQPVQGLLGHKSIVMTMKYAHLSPEHLHAAAERIGPGL
jgi:site-specific recombinase XerD